MRIPSLLLALALAPSLSAAAVPDYPTVAVPPGRMTLQVPLNTYLQTDYLNIPVAIPAGLRMGRYEVSNRDWDACFAAGGCARKAEQRADEGPDNPVARVNWHEAAQFARWLSGATGRRYRLPTQQEWYYVFSLGRDFRIQGRSYDYDGRAAVQRIPKRTWKRGHFGANAWGVCDLLGNVWEWTLSCYTVSEERLRAVPDLAALGRPGACSTRVLGGENCASAPDFIRDNYSGGCGTVEPAANLGFRLIEEE